MKNIRPLKARICAQADVTRVDVYDDIGEGGWFSEGVTAKSFAGQLAAINGPLEVHINSVGGDVWDGIAIKNAIATYSGHVTTVVDGIAASIASVIAQAGAERVMMPGSMLMIHDAFTYCCGNAAEMAKMAADLDQVSDNLAGIYAAAAGGEPGTWREAMRAETWYSADQAVEAGLADRTGDGAAVLPAGLDLEAFDRVPGQIAAQLRSLPRAAEPDAKADAVRIMVDAGLDVEGLVAVLRDAIRTRAEHTEPEHAEPEAAATPDAPPAEEPEPEQEPEHTGPEEPAAPEPAVPHQPPVQDHAGPPAWLEDLTTPLPAWLNTTAEEATQ